jgi:predicted nucleic acid-binding protein
LAEIAVVVEARSFARDGRADAIVSGDARLLDLEEFPGIPIARVAEFLSEPRR